MTEIKNSILAGLAFCILFGAFLAINFGIEYALTAGPLSGLAFGLAIYFFVTSRTVKKQTSVDCAGTIEIIRQGGANHFKNGEAVGGKLYLFEDGLRFKSHKFNIQNHELFISLTEIKDVRFFNSLGIVPNGLEIITTEGRKESFVVSGMRQWKEEIGRLKY